MTRIPHHHPKHRSRRPAAYHLPPLQVERPPLGLAGTIANVFIDSPLTPLLMIATLLVGILGLIVTPRQEDPQISVPMIDVFFEYPGASAEQVESLAVRPLERMMSEIPGVKHVYSAAERERGMVIVRFEVGEPLGPSIVKVHDKLQTNLDKIPPGVSMPLVQPKTVDDVPVVTVTLWSLELDDSELRILANDVLQRLEEVKDTGPGFVVGGRRQQIRIEVHPERLAGHGVTLDQVAETVRQANRERGAGTLEAGDQLLRVSTGGYLRSADDVADLVVGTQFGRPIYLRDVALVYEGPEETAQMVTYHSGPQAPASEPRTDGAPAVTVAIAKKEGTNGVRVANDILAKVDALKGRLIPENVQISVTRNYGKTANDKVNELLSALLEAALIVSVICFITIGTRPAMVVIIVIPLVILITIWSAWALNYTIDRVSLFALIFSIGILVDDATVVVENIFRRWLLEGRTSIDIAVDAVREVGNPTIIATLTILAALLPMGFVSGMMGPYMRPIPVLGSVAMGFSLFAAFVFTPWCSYQLRPRLEALKRAEERERRTQEIIGKIYRPIVSPFIRHRPLAWGLLGVVVIAFLLACSMFYTKAVTVKMLPFDNKPELNVVVNLPEGTALPVTANVTRRLAEALRGVPEVAALQSYVGTVSPFNFNGMVRHYYLRGKAWEGDIQVMLLDKHARERSSHQIAAAARTLLTPIARDLGARIAVVEMPPGPPVLQTVVAEVYGPDAETRREVARDLTHLFEQVPDIADVDNYLSEPHDRWRFEVDTEKATRRGVTVDTINRNLAMAMGGYQLGDVKREKVLEPVNIVVELPLSLRASTSALGQLPIPAADGATVPLAELGWFEKVPEDSIIYHTDLRPMEYVVGEMSGRLGAPIYGMLRVNELLTDYQTPDGVTLSGTLTGPPEDEGVSSFEWTGEWTVTYETFRDLGLAFAAALVLIYILLVIEFDDFLIPATVMLPIPLTIIGIVTGHWLLNAEFTATSMIGFIALAGIEVRNSILFVDFAKNEMHRGLPIEEAVLRAGQIRMRPIWVTDLTMMGGAATILFDPIFQGMAISLLFGALTSVTLTMLTLPLRCISARSAFCKQPSREDDTASEPGGAAQPQPLQSPRGESS
ncbi:MAG: efflux RND transporter permease subunit [Thiocapsa sp.]|nr:efflux RND transporter permease subunit [Thiocapsa sp.]MCG6896952.1 efflux RND transporter permease subunit [Thiocapsa sp.]MCG6984636.1 efflux RND transporter permease subunit [Thiocapsa sp.]